jgi:hypothetical protein
MRRCVVCGASLEWRQVNARLCGAGTKNGSGEADAWPDPFSRLISVKRLPYLTQTA